MSRNHVVRRPIVQFAWSAAALLFASPGSGAEPDHAKADHHACAAAYKNARREQQANHLRAAQELAETCAKPACGAVLRQECAVKYNQLDSDIPSIVPVAVDDGGSPLTDLEVKVDGELVTSKLDGRALPLDPGVHELSFTEPNGGTVTEKVMIVQGQHNRAITVSLHSPHPARKTALMAAVVAPKPVETKAEPRLAPAITKPSEPAPPSLLPGVVPIRETSTEPRLEPRGEGPGLFPYVLGGAGLAALGAGALFFAWGNNDNGQLSHCTPDCAPSTLRRIKTLYTMADVSFGVGVAALGVATYLYASSGSGAHERAPAKTATYSFDVEPTRSGAFATVSGSF